MLAGSEQSSVPPRRTLPAQQRSTATGRDVSTFRRTAGDGDLRGCTPGDVLPVVCKQGVASSSLASSTHSPRSEALSAGSTLAGRVEPFGWLGGIWEINFSLSLGVGGGWSVLS